jgi:hypothetical protein
VSALDETITEMSLVGESQNRLSSSHDLYFSSSFPLLRDSDIACRLASDEAPNSNRIVQTSLAMCLSYAASVLFSLRFVSSCLSFFLNEVMLPTN